MLKKLDYLQKYRVNFLYKPQELVAKNIYIQSIGGIIK